MAAGKAGRHGQAEAGVAGKMGKAGGGREGGRKLA